MFFLIQSWAYIDTYGESATHCQGQRGSQLRILSVSQPFSSRYPNKPRKGQWQPPQSNGSSTLFFPLSRSLENFVTNRLHFKGRQVKADWKLCKCAESLTTDMLPCRTTECPARLYETPQMAQRQVLSLGHLGFFIKGSSGRLLGAGEERGMLPNEPSCKYFGAQLKDWGCHHSECSFLDTPYV